MNLKHYQEKAVDKLYREVVDQLNASGIRRKIVFQAPTGAGKTVMITEVMSRLQQQLKEEDCQYRRVAFIWLAPNALHIQSYLSMKSAFSETHILEPVVYDNLDLGSDGYIQPGQVLFVNWQSINKEKNVMVRGSEQTASIYEIIERTRANHIALVCIIDEEHMFAGNNARKSERVLQQMQPKVELRVSATPVTANCDAKISISRAEVISEGMIKQNISLNPALQSVLAQSSAQRLNEILLAEACKKRRQIADAYRACGVNINPLLLIQLPNDDSETLSREENELKDNLLAALANTHSMSIENGKVAVWLANEKTNLDGIKQQDSLVDVLLFKQAIALGWDCPRAAVLLIFRKLNSFTFTIQTVGRIMRMPQQHFYGNSLLDIGYVYTDLSADKIKVEPDDATYINTLHAYRREELNNIHLTANKEERTNKENNILRSDFRRIFREQVSEKWLNSLQTNMVDTLFGEEQESVMIGADGTDPILVENRKKTSANIHIRFDVSRIQIEIPTNMELLDEEGEYVIRNKAGYARTLNELQAVFDNFCGSLLSGWSKSKALPLLEDTIVNTMETLYGLSEYETIKVVLYHDNQPKFREFISAVLNFYKNNIMEKRLAAVRGILNYEWEVPAIRDYSDATCHIEEDIHNHALLPFITLNEASQPEQHFTAFLEQHSRYIDWWYKNADSGAEHFAVRYTDTEGKERLFFVDYVIRMKNGTICLFDTKSVGGDRESVNKHNALIDYIAAEHTIRGKNIIGGIIIEDGRNVWKFSPMHIDNARDLAGWSTFFPDQYN